ncbi:MAG TPA: hypothetical protein VHA37_02990, partial [Candidatus Saccharimonadales bacterium]|nr:hypothetical protein [Candidatus Saccharimonadales bacterium]
MSEITGPPASGDPGDQIRWMAETCHFLVVRPDEPWEAREAVLLPEPEVETITSGFGLDGEYLAVTVPQEPAGDVQDAWISVAGQPERDGNGDWFVTEHAYMLSAPGNAALPPAIEVEQRRTYDLYGAILPEDYERIREEYEAQDRARSEAMQGLAGSAESFQEMKDMVEAMSGAVGMEM